MIEDHVRHLADAIIAEFGHGVHEAVAVAKATRMWAYLERQGIVPAPKPEGGQ